jgi:hypothetical protein
MDASALAILQLLSGSWVAQLLGSAARMRLVDHVADGPRSVDELARVTGAHPPSLARMLRALAGLGVLSSPSPGVFALGPLGPALRALREVAIAETDAVHWGAWQRLHEAVMTGRPQADPWRHYAEHPDEGATFAGAMGNLAAIAVEAVRAVYDVSGFATVVDVGGAHGDFLAGLLAASPRSRGVLFDLPHVIAGAPRRDRIETVGGDVFAAVPRGGDLYVLKNVLHDWDDERAVAILANVRAAMRPGTRVAVIEVVLPEAATPGPAQLLDLSMMVLLGGRERTEREYAALFEAAGLRLARTLAMPSPWAILEGASE